MASGWDIPFKMKQSQWNPRLMDFYNRRSDLDDSTFQFARTDGITAEAANVHPQDVSGLFPGEHVSKWVERKQRMKDYIQSQTDRRNGSDFDEAPRGPYRPITDAHEIRILEVYPGHFYDNIKGTLHHCSIEFEFDTKGGPKPNHNYFRTRHALSWENLNQPIWYTAISYTRGDLDPATDAMIECNGFKLIITRSLEMALRHFRQTDHSINIWVDQICIDHENPTEKRQQIQRMSRIYTHAVSTVDWLGEATQELEDAFELLKFLGTILQMEVDAPAPEKFEELFLPKPKDRIWSHLWDLLNTKWFSRVWIVQEAILSVNLWIMCGKIRILWDEFSTNFDNVSRSGLSTWLQNEWDRSETTHQARAWKCAQVLSAERLHYSLYPGKFALFSILTKTRDFQSQDPRDAVYGLLGICESTDIEISYDNTTVANVYHAAALSCLKSDLWHLFPILCCVDHQSNQRGLPSWVPDWGSRRQTNSLGFSTSSRAIYNAAGNWKPCFSTRSPGERELFVSGKIFDIVQNVSEVCLTPEVSSTDPKNANKHLIPWIELARQCLPYPSGCTLFQAFWSTLVAGANAEGIGKSPESFAEIFSLLLDESTGQHPTFPDQTYSPRQLRPKGKGKLELANLQTRTPAKTYQEIREAFRRAVVNRRLGKTEKTYLSLLPTNAQVGDLVCVILGCHVPFIIRKSDGNTFKLVGECYVHGIMDGEVIQKEDIAYSCVILA